MDIFSLLFVLVLLYLFLNILDFDGKKLTLAYAHSPSVELNRGDRKSVV